MTVCMVMHVAPIDLEQHVHSDLWLVTAEDVSDTHVTLTSCCMREQP